MKNDIFTQIIHKRGWTVISACIHWGVEYSDFRRKCRRILSGKAKNPNEKAQLLCMCRGLENRTSWDAVDAAGKLMDNASVSTNNRMAYLPKSNK